MAHQGIRLGVNVDHVATVRNARGGAAPCPVRAAELALNSGADGITIHVRQDRRHITVTDAWAIKAVCQANHRPLNLELSLDQFEFDLAFELSPDSICVVPEQREERTTETGLSVEAEVGRLRDLCDRLRHEGIRSTLFVDPNPSAVAAARTIGADAIEFHTGAFCDAVQCGDTPQAVRALDSLKSAAQIAHRLGLAVHAGHGIAFESALSIATIPYLEEVNIGHFLIGEAIYSGLPAAITKMRWHLTQKTDSNLPYLALKRKRALYRARYRGFREADLMLADFAEANLDRLNEGDVDEFEHLLEWDDGELYGLIVAETSVLPHASPLVRRIREHTLGLIPRRTERFASSIADTEPRDVACDPAL